MDNFSTKATIKDFCRAERDSCGVVYSEDGKRLLRCENKNLRHYTIAVGTEIICDNAFLQCINLAELSIPNSVRWIGRHAFECCTDLVELSIPTSVTEIWDKAFWGCDKLSKIVLQSRKPPVCHYDVFQHTIAHSSVLYVPAGARDNYVTKYEWRNFFCYIKEIEAQL